MTAEQLKKLFCNGMVPVAAQATRGYRELGRGFLVIQDCEGKRDQWDLVYVAGHSAEELGLSSLLTPRVLQAVRTYDPEEEAVLLIHMGSGYRMVKLRLRLEPLPGLN